MAEGNEYFVPRDVTKVDFLGQTYQLSWTPPRAPASQVQSYTVFWCLAKNGRERPYQVRKIFNITYSLGLLTFNEGLELRPNQYTSRSHPDMNQTLLFV